jgi:hypothetical protein
MAAYAREEEENEKAQRAMKEKIEKNKRELAEKRAAKVCLYPYRCFLTCFSCCFPWFMLCDELLPFISRFILQSSFCNFSFLSGSFSHS